MLKIEISHKQLTNTIEALNAYQARLEADAAALASLPGAIPRMMAERRAEEAQAVSELFDYFLGL